MENVSPDGDVEEDREEGPDSAMMMAHSTNSKRQGGKRVLIYLEPKG